MAEPASIHEALREALPWWKTDPWWVGWPDTAPPVAKRAGQQNPLAGAKSQQPYDTLEERNQARGSTLAERLDDGDVWP